MPDSSTARVRVEFTYECCANDGIDLVFNDADTRFPYAAYTPLHASLGLIAVARPSFGSSRLCRLGLEQDITSASAHVAPACILLAGSGPLLKVEGTNSNALSGRIVLAPNAIHAFTGQYTVAGAYGPTHLEILRAPFETRDSDVFPESCHLFDNGRRRQVWTAACLSASAMLPCETSRFIQAAEIIAHALNPRLPWNADEESQNGRIAAAVRAGIVVPELSLGNLREHPGLEAWRQLLGNSAGSRWPIIGNTAMEIARLSGRIRQTLQVWARHVSGQAPASGHDLLDAQDFLDAHRDQFDAMRSALFKQVSPFPMPPPSGNEMDHAS